MSVWLKYIIAETKVQNRKDVLAKIQAGAAHAKAIEKNWHRYPNRRPCRAKPDNVKD